MFNKIKLMDQYAETVGAIRAIMKLKEEKRISQEDALNFIQRELDRLSNLVR